MEKNRDKESGIVALRSEGLAHESGSLVRRGLVCLSTADMARVIDAAKALTSTAHPYSYEDTLSEQFNKLFPQYPQWSFLRMFPKTQELSCNIFSGKQLYEVDDQAFALMLNRLKVGQGIVGWVAQTNELLIVRDVREDSRFLATADVYPNVEVRSVVAVPLRSQESSCVGVLELINVVGPGGFPETDISLLQTFADFAAIGFGNQDTCASAAELGRFDGLTGFETKPYFETALRVRFKYIKRRFSLINIQLEDFETLSESESWQLINQLLVEVTRTIKANIRGFDSAFRYDSAEFFIDLVNATKENACNMALQLHGALKRTVSLVTGLEDPHVAMGVATYPSDFETKEDMFQRFDEAMLLLKISTGDGVVAVGKGILSPPTHCCDSDGGRR